MQNSRRLFLGTAATASLGGLLAACTSTTTNGVTTYSLNTAKIDQDGGAIISALAAALAAPSIVILLGPNSVVTQAALEAARLALAEFDTLTHGSVSVGVDTTKAVALVNTLIANAQTILGLLQQVIPKLPGSLATQVGNYVAATLVLIPFVQLAIGMSTASVARGHMTEADALRIAHH